MRKLVLAAAVSAAASLGACSTAVEAVRGPQLAPIGYPAALVPTQQAYMAAPAMRTESTPASANSLWRVGARTFFGDQRARHVGDILTVRIDIDDRAQTQNTTQRSRSNDASTGVSNFFGLESSLGRALPGGFDPSKMVGL
ncbi:MAG: flagellar basal body L-ring protein FlgH, partial [Pseudomonadota bacterium]|nr:flagellar basal body L-ring protein FlgH [Pseudomonadota bacterium]